MNTTRARALVVYPDHNTYTVSQHVTYYTLQRILNELKSVGISKL